MQCNTIQCNTIQCNAIQFNTIRYNTTQYNATQYNTIQCNAMQYNTMQYNTIQCNTIQYNTIQYNTMQCNAMQYYTMQCNTIQYNTIQYNTILFPHLTDPASGSLSLPVPLTVPSRCLPDHWQLHLLAGPTGSFICLRRQYYHADGVVLHLIVLQLNNNIIWSTLVTMQLNTSISRCSIQFL